MGNATLTGSVAGALYDMRSPSNPGVGKEAIA